jgi:hypothetical protein
MSNAKGISRESRWLARAGALLLALTIGACAEGEIGDACDEVGSTDECVDGAICAPTDGDSGVCAGLCDTQTDCNAEDTCTAVTSAASACL